MRSEHCERKAILANAGVRLVNRQDERLERLFCLADGVICTEKPININDGLDFLVLESMSDKLNWQR